MSTGSPHCQHRCQAMPAAGPRTTFRPARDAAHSTWQCMHCLQTFWRCQKLAYHIEYGACQHFNDIAPKPTAPPVRRPELLDKVRTQRPDSCCKTKRCARNSGTPVAICSQNAQNQPACNALPPNCKQQHSACLAPGNACSCASRASPSLPPAHTA